MAYNLTGAYPNFEYVLQSMSIIFLIAIPILTMRVIAEERRQKTDQLLYALPIGMTRVVLGKYLAMIDAGETKQRVVCDYIAGMTDQYAITKFGEYFLPRAWQVDGY